MTAEQYALDSAAYYRGVRSYRTNPKRTCLGMKCPTGEKHPVAWWTGWLDARSVANIPGFKQLTSFPIRD